MQYQNVCDLPGVIDEFRSSLFGELGAIELLDEWFDDNADDFT